MLHKDLYQHCLALDNSKAFHQALTKVIKELLVKKQHLFECPVKIKVECIGYYVHTGPFTLDEYVIIINYTLSNTLCGDRSMHSAFTFNEFKNEKKFQHELLRSILLQITEKVPMLFKFGAISQKLNEFRELQQDIAALQNKLRKKTAEFNKSICEL